MSMNRQETFSGVLWKRSW